MIDVINNLKSLRKSKGLSLQKLAEYAGTTKSHVHTLEKGESVVGLSLAYAISNVLCVSVYDIWADNTECEELQHITINRVTNL